MKKVALRVLSAIVLSLLAALPARAFEPMPFHAVYTASYRGMRAQAERSLAKLQDEQYRLTSSVELKLLGKTLTGIEEVSLFSWNGESVRSQSYAFVQRGLGSRARSVAFDWGGMEAQARNDDGQVRLPLQGLVFDELNAYLELTRQLADGARDVTMHVVDKDRIEEEHYRVVSEAALDTSLGSVQALELEKVRDVSSERVTRLWLVPEWNYLLVKLYQRDAKGREMELALNEASIDGHPLTL